ncbi:MAG: protein translocase subunit SecF [Actinobacteria bacterium]|nr:protein translocase subunit SecF [Actinomycetota bacterium]
MITMFRKIARGEANFDIASQLGRWMIVSGVVLLLSIGGLVFRGLNLSLEFKGGSSYDVPIASSQHGIKIADVQNALQRFELGEFKVQVTGVGGPSDHIIVRAPRSTQKIAEVQSALATLAGQPTPDTVSVQDVGPTWGKQVSTKALRGLLVFLILVTVYISFRFEWKMAFGALAALFHDLLATAGIYALVGFQVSPATVIALLTLLGYSLYDTVVVFDKVRENVELQGPGARTPYTELVNQSVNQVLMRSINTALATLLPIGALLFVGVYAFGAKTLEDLALAMFIGTLVGTYSSIFIASPILAKLKERDKRWVNVRARATGAPVRETRRVAATTTADGDQGGVATQVRQGADPIRVQRAGAPRPRRQRRGKRR